MRILVGSTIPAFKMTPEGHWWHWLKNADRIVEVSAAAGHQVDWLAVLQTDGRGHAPFSPLLNVTAVDFEAHWFSIDTGHDQIDGGNRLAPICVGRNLIIDHAIRHLHDAIYFADADIEAPDDILVRLAELDYPVVGANVPTYCLDGPQADGPPPAGPFSGDVREHWNTAGSLLVARQVFRRVPWRYDPDAGETDDPATQAEMARLGWPTLVRHDVECVHWPQAIGPVEGRGHDLTVYR